MCPLAQHAARGEPCARRLEEFPREQRGDAGHPRVRGFRDDHVVLPRRQQQVGAAVADDEARAGPQERALVHVIEVVRGLDDFGRDLDHVRVDGRSDRPERRVQRHAAAEADDREMAGVAVQQHGQQPEQPLRQHVAAVRGVHLAVDRQRPRARQRADADRRRGAFLVELETPGAQHCGEVRRLQVRRVLVGAAREELAVPGGEE